MDRDQQYDHEYECEWGQVKSDHHLCIQESKTASSELDTKSGSNTQKTWGDS